jgi:glucose dehydrogenase
MIALDAATGKLLWSFNPNEDQKVVQKMNYPGLTYWEQGSDRRIYGATRANTSMHAGRG